MEILFSVGLVLGLVFIVLIILKLLKDFIFNKKFAKVNAEIAIHKEQAKLKVSEWVNREKEHLQKQFEAEMTEKRSVAVAEIEAWSSEEKKRLNTRYAKDYEDELAKLRQELNVRMDSELENIRTIFAEFSTEEKKLAEEDIKRFIMKKLTPGE